MIELDEPPLDGILEKGDERVGPGGAYVEEPGVDPRARVPLHIRRTLVPLRHHVDPGRRRRPQAREHILHEDDCCVHVKHIEARGDEGGDGEHAFGAHPLHVPL